MQSGSNARPLCLHSACQQKRNGARSGGYNYLTNKKKDGLGNAIAISTKGDIPQYPQPYPPNPPPGRQEGPSEYAVQGAQNP